MSKPQHRDLYDKQVTEDCERVLVTLLRGLGPWKKSVFLVGGLAPRYLVGRRPPDVPAHAGTGDVDLVVDVAILAETEAYQTLEENLKRMGFSRAENAQGKPTSWRWKVQLEHGGVLVIEFLADEPSLRGGRPQELPGKGNVSAINIPYAAMVLDLHETREVTAELLGERGRAIETVAYADIVSFTCLKALAYDDRHEGKDAHDLVYCLEHGEGGVDAGVERFRVALGGPHAGAIRLALGKLRNRFCGADGEGYRLDGPVAVAMFEDATGEGEARLLRQRGANDVLERLIVGLVDLL
jgi:hypothetical protein